VTGMLIAPVLAPIVAQISDRLGGAVDLLPIENGYFGAIVNVAGLLTAGNLLAALRPRRDDGALGDLVAIPRAALDVPGERFLDDLTPAQVSAELGRPVVFVETLQDLLNALAGTTPVKMTT
ncbi:MAG TPA: DUF512 domain-containing protein, partial [Chloroflexota bacterium]